MRSPYNPSEGYSPPTATASWCAASSDFRSERAKFLVCTAIGRIADRKWRCPSCCRASHRPGHRLSSAPIAVAVSAILLLSVSDWGLSALSIVQSSRAVSIRGAAPAAASDASSATTSRSSIVYPTGGSSVSRVLSDTQAFSEVVTMTIGVVSEIVLATLIFAYLFTIDVPLTLVALILVPAKFSVSLGFRRLSRRVVTQSRRSVADVSGHVHETMSGIAVAKSFRKEQLLYDQFAPVNERSARLGWRHDVVISSLNAAAGHRRRAGLRGAGVCGRDTHGVRRPDHRRMVPVPADRPPAVVPARHDRLVLEPVPARPGRRGTGVRPARRRPAGGADRVHAGAGGNGPHRAAQRALPDKEGEGVFEDFSLTVHCRRDPGAGGPYRFRQVEHHQAGGPTSTSFRAARSWSTGATSAAWIWPATGPTSAS